jgi:putative endonuclease
MTFAGRLLELERRTYTALRARADRKIAAKSLASGAQPKPPHLLTGERGEAAACFHLRSLGYRVVARRWQNPKHRGDLDLVAWDGHTLVIVEVKTRSARDIYPADLTVDRAKRNQLRLHLEVYLRRIPEPHRTQIATRFDILSVYLLPTGAEFEHRKDAFSRRQPPQDRPRRFHF